MDRELHHHIFLSYSRKDLPAMQRLLGDLRAAGLVVWTDEKLEPGTPDWEKSIALAIKSAVCVVVLLSPDSEQSPWVGRELAFAETFGLRIFPILVRGDERNAIPFRLISHQWVDARQDYQRAFTNITTAIHKHIHGVLIKPTSPIVPPAQPQPTYKTVKPVWQFETKDEIRGAPAFFENKVYVGSYDESIYAIDLETGQRAWGHMTNGAISTSPVVDTQNRLVIVGCEDNTLYTLDTEKGRITWTYPTKDRIRSAATLAHNCVFWGSDDGKLYAAHSNNGRLLWTYNAGSPIRSRPFVSNEMVYFGTEGGELHALDVSGRLKWSFRAHQRQAITASPIYDNADGIVYAASMNNNVYACDASNGSTVWKYTTNGPVASSPLLNNGKLYFGSMDGNFYAISADKAKEKWRYETNKPIIASPVMENGLIYFGGTDNNFYCIDHQTGQEVWRYEGQAPFMGGACIANDKVIVGSLDHNLYAFPLVAPDN